MESLPPARQTSQRRTAAPEQTSSRSQPQTASSQTPPPSQSEDSQTLFTNDPEQTQEQDYEQEPQTREHGSPEEQRPAPPADTDADAMVKKCWICFSDSTEDTPETSPWRDPCPCALVAHEECLLDWIADMEAPNNRRTQRGMAAPKIECPQCKSEIVLARPRNLLVEAVRGVERAASQVVTPSALTVLGWVVYSTSMSSGIHSIYAVFGADDGARILEPLIINAVRPPVDVSIRDLGQRLLNIALDHVVHWRLYIGVPLITPMLLLSRTSLADSFLPVLPIVFFATQNYSPHETVDFGQWPPSASLAFSLLPYLRWAYNGIYQKTFAVKEKQWLKEIQPRARDAPAEDAANPNPEPEARDREDEGVFEVRIDGGIWDDWEDADSEDEEEERRPVVAQPEPFQGNRADPPPNIVDNRRQAPPAQPNQNAANQPQQAQAPAANVERRLSFSPTAIAETVLGTLAFPTIAGLSGELLKLALPRAWTAAPSTQSADGVRVVAKGLLHEKWARSLVGGCLFVLCKDCVMLYVRWKMAQMHRKRRVVDYQGKRRTAASAG